MQCVYWVWKMTDFDPQELQLIIFLCIQRQSVVGIEECEKEGTSDLYNHAWALVYEN